MQLCLAKQFLCNINWYVRVTTLSLVWETKWWMVVNPSQEPQFSCWNKYQNNSCLNKKYVYFSLKQQPSSNVSVFIWNLHRIQLFFYVAILASSTLNLLLCSNMAVPTHVWISASEKEKWRGGNVLFLLLACNRNFTHQILSEFIAQHLIKWSH